MNSEVEEWIKDMKLGSAISQRDLDELLKQIDFSLPEDYIEFLRNSNGAEGVIGNNYLRLWKAEDLSKMNRGYEVDEYASGHFVFGSNGGGSAYAFNKETLIVVTFEFVSMLIADKPEVLSKNFLEFLKFMAET